MRHADDAPVLRHDTDGVTTLTLNRPERFNALSEERLGALTATLCAKSAVALRTGKAMFQRQQEMPLSRACAYAGEMMAANMMADDVDEGIAAFLAKRRPAWRDR